MKVILLCFSIALLTACSSKTPLIKTEIIRQNIPSELLIISELEKPIIQSQKDAINAYVELFFYADDLKFKLKAIKALNDQNISL